MHFRQIDELFHLGVAHAVVTISPQYLTFQVVIFVLDPLVVGTLVDVVQRFGSLLIQDWHLLVLDGLLYFSKEADVLHRPIKVLLILVSIASHFPQYDLFLLEFNIFVELSRHIRLSALQIQHLICVVLIDKVLGQCATVSPLLLHYHFYIF